MSIKKFINSKLAKAIVILLLFLCSIYYLFFTLDKETISRQQLIDNYQYSLEHSIDFKLNKVAERVFEFSYRTFDGSRVKGKMSYPVQVKDKYPVLIGMHAMGRSYPRWWLDSLKGRATVTQVNKLTKLAQSKGYVVIAIDARLHGSRKVASKSLRSIMFKMNFLGDKQDYQKMISHSVIDHRVLLDWVTQRADLDSSQVNLAGYSMGGQMSLLLAAVDQRIANVLSIVPPYLDDKLAMVAPKNVVAMLNKQKIWLVTADDDENASEEQNLSLFKAINSKDKKHIIFPGSHILPNNYVHSLKDWF